MQSFYYQNRLIVNKESSVIDQMFPPFSPENTDLMIEAADSPQGQVLDHQIRYEKYLSLPDGVDHRFMAEPEYSLTSIMWQDLLGADVNNLQHNPYTALIGKWICIQENVDADTMIRVERMGLVHDLAEAVFNPNTDRGDVSYDEAQKFDSNVVEQEHQEIGEILSQGCFSTISPDAIDQVVVDLNDSKQGAPNTIPGQIFAIAEKLGYVMTALNSFELV